MELSAFSSPPRFSTTWTDIVVDPHFLSKLNCVMKPLLAALGLILLQIPAKGAEDNIFPEVDVTKEYYWSFSISPPDAIQKRRMELPRWGMGEFNNFMMPGAKGSSLISSEAMENALARHRILTDQDEIMQLRSTNGRLWLALILFGLPVIVSILPRLWRSISQRSSRETPAGD